MRVESNGEGVECRRLPKIKGDPCVFHALRLAKRGRRFGTIGARIEDDRVVACVDDLGRVVIPGILQLATHALAPVRCRLHGERVAAHCASAAGCHVFRRSAGKEDARRLEQAALDEGKHGWWGRRGRRSEGVEVQEEVAVERAAAGVEDGALDVVRSLEATNASVVEGVGVTCECTARSSTGNGDGGV